MAARTTVHAVMLTATKTHPRTITVEQARAAFGDDHVHALLIVDHCQRLHSVITRKDLDHNSIEHALAERFGRLEGRLVAADDDAEQTRLMMMRSGVRRLAVTSSEGFLVGLLCLKRTGLGFCSDTDVAARAAERCSRRGGSVDVNAQASGPFRNRLGSSGSHCPGTAR